MYGSPKRFKIWKYLVGADGPFRAGQTSVTNTPIRLISVEFGDIAAPLYWLARLPDERFLIR